MANQYDRQALILERRRQIAEALRASGNEALPASLDSGRIHAPVSGWAHADKALKQILGGLSERQINKDEAKLAEEQRAAQEAWMSGLADAQAPSTLQPVAATGALMAEDPDAMQSIQRRMRGAAIRGETQQAVDSSDRSKLLAHYMKGGDVGGMPAAISAAGIQRELLPPASEPFTLGQGEKRFDARGKVVASGDPKTDAEARQLVDIVDPNSPAGYRTILESDWKGEQRYHKPDAPGATIINKQESAEAAATGKGLGEEYLDYKKAGNAAIGKLARLDRMTDLASRMGETGKLAPAMKEVAAVAEYFGVKLDPDLGAKQAFESLSNEIALSFRNPLGGAGMPGALSDKDREFLMGIAPGLSKTPEGNRLIIEYARKIAQRDLEVSKMARKYKAKNGTIEGFDEELYNYALANPLFASMTAPPPPADDAVAPPARSGQGNSGESAADRAKRLGIS